jgi:hypothetical protein
LTRILRGARIEIGLWGALRDRRYPMACMMVSGVALVFLVERWNG